MKWDTGSVTTVLGAGLSIAVGLVDHWAFRDSLGGNLDVALIMGGLGALLGVNPLQRVGGGEPSK